MKSSNSDSRKYEKIFFYLQKDEDDYPPNDWETLWAFEVSPNLYSIDNIPFFARNISWGDIVSITQKGKELHYQKTVQYSGHSVVRVIVYNHSEREKLHKTLQKMGCDTEQSHLPSLITVDIPPSIDINLIREYLNKGEAEDKWEYEESSIQHKN
jgi:hypothetical protein